jgi:microcystin-dependent protein
MGEMTSHNHSLMVDASHQGTINTPANNTVLAQTVGVPSSGGTFPFGIYGAFAPGATLAPQTITNTGGSQAHTNLMPFLCLNICIALQGIFPSQT